MTEKIGLSSMESTGTNSGVATDDSRTDMSKLLGVD